MTMERYREKYGEKDAWIFRMIGIVSKLYTRLQTQEKPKSRRRWSERSAVASGVCYSNARELAIRVMLEYIDYWGGGGIKG